MKWGFVAAATVSFGLLVGVCVTDEHSLAARLVAALGALGQVWIAALLLYLTWQQFQFMKWSTEHNSRITNYERRKALHERWNKSSLQIGYTNLNVDNVTALAGLLGEITWLFGAEARTQADAAVKAARAARKRAAIVLKAGNELSSDDEYRACIDKFQDLKAAVWRIMQDRTKLDV